MTVETTVDYVPIVDAPARVGRAVRVEIVRDGRALDAVLRQFDDAADRTVFQHGAVITTWVQTIGADTDKSGGDTPVDWFVVVVSKNGSDDPLLVLPMVRRREGAVWVIEGADHEVCDFNGAAWQRGFAPGPIELAEIWAQICSALPRADVVRLSKLPQVVGSRANPLLGLPNVNRMDLSHLKAHLGREGEVWTTDAFPAATRDQLVERRRKLGKRGRLEFRTAANETDADAFFAALLQQRAARCHELGRNNILDSAAHRSFYRALVMPDNAASIGVLQALMLDDQIIATGYGLIGNGAFHMIFPTFVADRWRNYSPGLQLFAASMEWSAGQGLTHYDFTIGAEGFKRDLGGLEFPLFELLVAQTLRGRLFVAADRLKRYVKSHSWLSGVARKIRANPVLTGLFATWHL
jgi:CelD/BcsL family acetyltransferase involved in cellulose biosynthesis